MAAREQSRTLTLPPQKIPGGWAIGVAGAQPMPVQEKRGQHQGKSQKPPESGRPLQVRNRVADDQRGSQCEYKAQEVPVSTKWNNETGRDTNGTRHRNH